MRPRSIRRLWKRAHVQLRRRLAGHHRGHSRRDADGRRARCRRAAGCREPARARTPGPSAATSRRRPTRGVQPTQPPFLGGGGAPDADAGALLDRHLRPDETAQTIGPIVGVRRDAQEARSRKWRDRDYYDEWRFIAGDADNDVLQAFDPNRCGARGLQPDAPNA